MLKFLIKCLRRYLCWLHDRWPAGTVERLPEIGEDGATRIPGLFIAGDLTGIPLLKFSLDSGARTARLIHQDPSFQKARKGKEPGVRDLIILGAGVAGMAAAVEARKAGLDFTVFEASKRFSTIVNFPKGKPIYTYPRDMDPAGDLKVEAEIKEALVEELEAQTREVEVVEGKVESVTRQGRYLLVGLAGGEQARALRVIITIGRSGNYRQLSVKGEELAKVYNRLHDPADFCDKKVLVVGGGDSAVETAIALAQCGSEVTLSYRGSEFSRPKQENLEMLRYLASDPDGGNGLPTPDRVIVAADSYLADAGERVQITLEMSTRVEEIRADSVLLKNHDGFVQAIPNDVVFTMLGRNPPLEFLRRSGIPISGEWNWKRVTGFALFILFCAALYNWKSGGILDALTRQAGAFPYLLENWFTRIPPKSLLGITLKSAAHPSFWYTLAYSLIVAVFGFRRIRRRKTPYVKWQTLTLIAIQVVPLFLLPEILLPWFDGRGWLPAALADSLFPVVNYGHGREFWRAYGFILAWPLNIYNVFTDQPIWGWLIISFVQTCVLIPTMIYFWGKGSYCGWICSCGALAETLGDTQRHKMPHGPGWNKLNMAGQLILGIAVLMLIMRVTSWIFPQWESLRELLPSLVSNSAYSYKWVVDVFLAGVVGYGVYFWYSGRVWCRFFCPLAALMHIYTRFSRFRILSDKKKCISCNVCTSVCHQGIDVMNFANKGLPMADPQCVRCSACVSSCPTGVLSFGQVDAGGNVISVDRLKASLVQIREA